MECRLYLEDAPRAAEYAADEMVDLGGYWEAVNFLLTGKRESDGSAAAILVEDWPDIEGSEAAMIDAESLAAFAGWIVDQSDAALFERFDPSAMLAANVYRAESVAADPVMARENLANAITSLKTFAARGAQIGSGAIRVII